MNSSNIKIRLLIPYFGKWPSYFNLFLKGCENNTWLDIIFLTDCEIPVHNLPNIHFHNFNLLQFSILASKKLDLKISISHAYKLCDFRPCYGLIFEDYLRDYDYWGYGDIDLIYGDLYPFIFDRIEQGYDVLSNRAEILSGSLSLFKNTNYIKNLYAQSSEFINLLGSKNYEGLDETAFNHTNWQGGEKANLPSHSFTYIIDSANSKGKIKASFITTCKEEITSTETVRYKDGIVWFEKKSLAYYHYVCNKNKEEYIIPNWPIVPDNFFVTTTGFYIDNSFYTLIHNYRKIVGFINNISKRIWKRLINKQC